MPTHAIPHGLVPERASLRLGVEWHEHNSTAGELILFQEVERNSCLHANTMAQSTHY